MAWTSSPMAVRTLEFLFHRFEIKREAASRLEAASLLKIIRLPETLFPGLPDVVSKMPTAGMMPVSITFVTYSRIS